MKCKYHGARLNPNVFLKTSTGPKKQIQDSKLNPNPNYRQKFKTKDSCKKGTMEIQRRELELVVNINN